jgi:hypothetical protein
MKISRFIARFNKYDGVKIALRKSKSTTFVRLSKTYEKPKNKTFLSYIV